MNWKELALEAIKQVGLGNKNEAKRYFELSMKLGPDQAWPYVKFVDLLSDMLDLDEKSAIIEKAMEVDPDDFWVNLFFLELLAKKYNIQGIFYAFESKFHDQIKSNPDLIKICDNMFPVRVDVTKLNNFADANKNSLVFINHDSSFFGATHYLFSLFDEMKSMGVNCCILDCTDNKALYEKYGVSSENVLSYNNDCFLINEVCNLIKPRLVYVNSMNKSLVEFCSGNKKFPMITHSHEVHEVYSKGIPKPTYVVSERIRKQYEQRSGFLPLVQPPILTQKVMELIDEEIKKDALVSNKFGMIDPNKISIGMCGQTEKRKNPDLFLEAAKKHPQYNFIWVGGDVDIFEDVPNVYHVKTVELPFKYYMLFDYFFLFSTQDPCPYVVLENLYVNNKVVTFKENIYTDHKCKMLGDLYFEYDGEVSLESVSYMIENHATEKAKRVTDEGRKYIKQKFAAVNKELIAVLAGNTKK
jgi:glycosyltransferase involved in cell wall biosynthesis